MRDILQPDTPPPKKNHFSFPTDFSTYWNKSHIDKKYFISEEKKYPFLLKLTWGIEILTTCTKSFDPWPLDPGPFSLGCSGIDAHTQVAPL